MTMFAKYFMGAGSLIKAVRLNLADISAFGKLWYYKNIKRQDKSSFLFIIFLEDYY